MHPTDALLQTMVRQGRTPSVQYLHFNQQEVLHHAAYGMADIAQQRPVALPDGYAIFSLTKTFTALAVLQLAQQRRLDIDAPARAYLPSFPYTAGITIRQLLNHTAGISNPIPLAWVHFEDEPFDRNTFFATVFAKHHRLKHPPGERFAYSNLGYVLLGQLIEQVSGLSFEAYVTKEILVPLGMDADAGFAPMGKRQVKGYHKQFSFSNLLLSFLLDKKKFMDKAESGWKPFKPVVVHAPAYGGLFATPMALVRYGQSFIGAPSLLSESYQAILFEENKINGRPTGMCLSWFTAMCGQHRYVAHPGGGGGFYVELRLYPALQRGSLLLCNRTGFSNEKLLDAIDAQML